MTLKAVRAIIFMIVVFGLFLCGQICFEWDGKIFCITVYIFCIIGINLLSILSDRIRSTKYAIVRR
jgi:hypothetical protein